MRKAARYANDRQRRGSGNYNNGGTNGTDTNKSVRRRRKMYSHFVAFTYNKTHAKYKAWHHSLQEAALPR